MIGANSILGLITLILLELVLGIDNLVFITILAGKLSPTLARKASIIGLSFALITRLCLLFIIGTAATLTHPLFSVFSIDITIRKVILFFGGVFLLAKATTELHEKIEGPSVDDVPLVKGVLWQVIVQIVILDAVFSLDSIITAVGMVHDMRFMVVAIVIAMIFMIFASRVLMDFILQHPTIIILCLGFVMMIGFNLLVESVGFEISKGYLYAAVGFSAIIEFMNQVISYKRKKKIAKSDLRSRTASAVLRLLSNKKSKDFASISDTVDVISINAEENEVFQPTEKEMIKGVLDLADRTVRSIMSPRNEVEWLDISHTGHELYDDIRKLTHSRVIVARQVVDEFLGVVLTKDLLTGLIDNKRVDWKKHIRQPLVVHENVDVLTLMDKMRTVSVQMAIVVDEHGSFEGVVTPTDIFKAISGDFIYEDDKSSLICDEQEGRWLVDASIDIRYLSSVLDVDLVDDNDRYTTLSGYVLWHLGRIPQPDEFFESDGLKFEIIAMQLRNITKVRITRGANDPDS